MSPTRPKNLRDGWTTGTCASAAAKAALVGLVEGQVPRIIEVGLPKGRRVTFATEVPQGSRTGGGDACTAIVVKDAGDDPDCTDGARMTAEVRWAGGGITELAAGPGVGTVTRPGLGLPIGAPAINPVPERMIRAALAEVTDRPVVVTFSVPGGETMAQETTNARLGIVGGISILGTTGIVRPFSTAAFRASVAQQVNVAAACGERHMVLATGSRSEAGARGMLNHLDPVCFVEVGDYTGVALGRVAANGMERATMVAMAGKITKLAAGVMMTHFHRSDVDNDVLAEAAEEAGASKAVLEAARATATARHFYEVCIENGESAPLAALCARAARACAAHMGGKVAMEVWMVDFEGTEVVARG